MHPAGEVVQLGDRLGQLAAADPGLLARRRVGGGRLQPHEHPLQRPEPLLGAALQVGGEPLAFGGLDADEPLPRRAGQFEVRLRRRLQPRGLQRAPPGDQRGLDERLVVAQRHVDVDGGQGRAAGGAHLVPPPAGGPARGGADASPGRVDVSAVRPQPQLEERSRRTLRRASRTFSTETGSVRRCIRSATVSSATRDRSAVPRNASGTVVAQIPWKR